MAHPAQATRALLFMRQCRARSQAQLSSSDPSNNLNNLKRSSSTFNDPTALSPDNFGKQLRLEQTSPEPLPQWRIPKPQLKTITATIDPETNLPIPDTTHPPTTTTLAPAKPDPYDFPRARDFPVPRYRSNPAIKPGLWSFIKHRILRLPEPPNPHSRETPFNILTNPYRARKTWPPILNTLSENQQFHYEKKFRRRLLNKTRSLRYNWDRWTLFARRFGVGFLLFYFAFIAEPGAEMRVPSDGLRYLVYGWLRTGGTAMTTNEEDTETSQQEQERGGWWPAPISAWIEENYQYYKRKHKRQWDPNNLEGWDDTRPADTLPGKVAPAVNRPLGDPVEGRDY